MALTKITKIEWLTTEDQLGNQAFDDERLTKIQEMTEAGKTDGHPMCISDVITERYWLDQPAAQEYIDYITLKTTQYNLSVVSMQIIDVP